MATAIDQIAARLTALYPEITRQGDAFHFASPDGGRSAFFQVKSDDLYGHDAYTNARSKSFDERSFTLTLNSSVELPLILLDSHSYYDPEYTFQDGSGNKVRIGVNSRPYQFARFYSAWYEQYAERRRERGLNHLRFENLLPRTLTATYTAKGRKIPADLHGIAIQKVNACLVKLSVEANANYSLFRPSQYTPIQDVESAIEDWTIPNCRYDENVVGYYKVARASPFASQSFLAYYNVLEYFFLRVAEDQLHKLLSATVNSTSFKSNSDGLDKVISIVRGQDAQRKEKELLRGVLQCYVRPEELIAWIKKFEVANPNRYSKAKKIFGEHFKIDIAASDTTIPTTAALLKHIRNAIVHSTDVYDRTERHLPLSDSEYIIEDYIPLIRFVAERVLFGTASAP